MKFQHIIVKFLKIDDPANSQFLQINFKKYSIFFFQSEDESVFYNIINNLLYLYLLIFISCFSLLKPPPITFTQSQTVAEKQMLGDNKELQPDGWLISSTKTSALGPIEWRKEYREEFENPKDGEEYRLLLKIIFHTAPEIKNLKQLKYVGENMEGSLSILEAKRDPKFDKIYRKEEQKKRANELIQLVNKTRMRIKELLVQNKKVNMILHNKSFPAEIGEYYEERKGIWIIKE